MGTIEPSYTPIDPKLYEFYSMDESENAENYNALSWDLSDEINKNGTLNIRVNKTHPRFSEIKKHVSYFLLADDDECLFFGKATDINENFTGDADITCEGYFSVWYSLPFTSNTKFEDQTIEQIFSAIISELRTNQYSVYRNGLVEIGNFYPEDEYHQYTFDNLIGKSFGDFVFNDLTNETEGVALLRVVGGRATDGQNYYRVDHLYLDWYGSIDGLLFLDAPGLVPDYDDVIENNPARKDILESKSFKLGINMLSLSKEYPISDVVTGICATYVLNRGDEYNERKYVTSPHYSSTAKQKFGSIIQVVDTSEDFDSSSEADAKAEEFASLFCHVWPDKLSINGIDPHFIDSSFERIKIGDAINCYSEYHDVNTVMQCLSYNLNPYNMANCTYVIGPYIPNNNINKDLTSAQKRAIDQYKFIK